MKSTYTPDIWRVVSVTNEAGESHHRVLAGWYGGFAHGDSWKLSSGIEQIIDKKTYWEMPQTSGSVYFCYKGNERLSSYTQSVLNNLTQNTKDVTIEMVDIETLLEQYKHERQAA